MLTEGNERDLGMIFQNDDLEYSPNILRPE
jgi:hypothetical protein